MTRPKTVERGQIWSIAPTSRQTKWVVVDADIAKDRINWNPLEDGFPDRWLGTYGWTVAALLARGEFFGWYEGYGPRDSSPARGEETGDNPAPPPKQSPVSSSYYDADPDLLRLRRAMGFVLNKDAAKHVLGERPALAEAPCPAYYPTSSS